MNSTHRTESSPDQPSPAPQDPSVDLLSPAASQLPAALLGARALLTGAGEAQKFGAYVLLPSLAATLLGRGFEKVFMALVHCSVVPPRGAPLPACSGR